MVFILKAVVIMVLCPEMWPPASATFTLPTKKPRENAVIFQGNNDANFKVFLDQAYRQLQVNSQTMVGVKKQVYDLISKILAKVAKKDPCYDFEVVFKGSTYEGLKVGQPDEFDFGLVRKNWDHKFVVQTDGTTPVGYGYAVQQRSSCLEQFAIPGTRRINASRVRYHLRKRVEEAMEELGISGEWVSKRPWTGGPAVTFEFLRLSSYPFVSIDLTIGLRLEESYWPPNANTRPVNTNNARVQLVPKAKSSTGNVAQWTISFTQFEAKILQKMDARGGCQKKVLQLAKYFKGKSPNRWYPLSTYDLKTILFYLDDEMKLPEFWKDSELVPRFRDLINRLLKHLDMHPSSRSLPNFFMARVDLWENKQDYLRYAKKEVRDYFLKTLAGNPQALLQR